MMMVKYDKKALQAMDRKEPVQKFQLDSED
jgi:hypothetical protein